jgi:hypothetical protein
LENDTQDCKSQIASCCVSLMNISLRCSHPINPISTPCSTLPIHPTKNKGSYTHKSSPSPFLRRTTPPPPSHLSSLIDPSSFPISPSAAPTSQTSSSAAPSPRLYPSFQTDCHLRTPRSSSSSPLSWDSGRLLGMLCGGESMRWLRGEQKSEASCGLPRNAFWRGTRGWKMQLLL